MTISTSVGRQFTVRQVVTMAYRLAGQLEASQLPSTEQLAVGREALETIIDAIDLEGVSARATAFVNVTLVSGTFVYQLSRSTIDVLDPGKYIAAGQDTTSPDSESIVTVVSREEWQAIAARSATGQPTLMYVHKELDQLELYLWPIPDEAGTIRLLTGRRLADVDSDDATIDLETYWIEYLKHALASQVAEASSANDKKIFRLETKATTLLRKTRARATQQLDTQIVVSHDTGWNS